MSEDSGAELAQVEAVRRGRVALVRGLLMYMLLLAVDTLLIWYIVASGPRGLGWVTLSAITVLGVLVAFQVWLHARDLQSEVVVTEGEVLRMFTRAELIVAWQSHYVQIEKRIFRVRPEDYIFLKEGMPARVTHFPHTLNVIAASPGGGA